MASVVGTSTFPDVIVPRPRPLSPNVKGLLEGLWEATRRLPAARARRKRWHWAAPHKRLGSLASPAYNERSGEKNDEADKTDSTHYRRHRWFGKVRGAFSCRTRLSRFCGGTLRGKASRTRSPCRAERLAAGNAGIGRMRWRFRTARRAKRS